MVYPIHLFQPHMDPLVLAEHHAGGGGAGSAETRRERESGVSAMMSGELWPPHAISRLPSKAAPALGSAPVLPAAHGTQPASLKLVADTCLAKLTGSAAAGHIFLLKISQRYVWRRLGMTGGGSSLGPVRLTLANLPNHPHNPQPSNPPPPTHSLILLTITSTAGRPCVAQWLSQKSPQSPRASHAVC